MLTLARLAKEQKGTPTAQASEQLLSEILDGFKLGERELKGATSFGELRAKLDVAIENLR